MRLIGSCHLVERIVELNCVKHRACAWLVIGPSDLYHRPLVTAQQQEQQFESVINMT